MLQAGSTIGNFYLREVVALELVLHICALWLAQGAKWDCGIRK